MFYAAKNLFGTVRLLLFCGIVGPGVAVGGDDCWPSWYSHGGPERRGPRLFRFPIIRRQQVAQYYDCDGGRIGNTRPGPERFGKQPFPHLGGDSSRL